jgi:hypothetical protein
MVVTVLILYGRPADAGVVVSETEVQNGIHGSAKLQKTVYVQGRKQKIETPNSQTIIDLDQGRIYVIDSNRRSYLEIAFPLEGDRASRLPRVKLGVVALTKTGATRWIGGYSCNEYQGIAKVGGMDIVIDQCISKDAPGALELAAFQRALSSKLAGQKPKASTDSGSRGIALELRSTIRPRTTSATRGGRANAPLVTTQTEVGNIRVSNLPAATFEPPAGFRKVVPQTTERGLEV